MVIPYQSLLARIGTQAVSLAWSPAVETLLWLSSLPERRALKEARSLAGRTAPDGANPLISVTIPTYNRAAILADRAVRSVLDQTYTNFEVVVVGDGCTDDTAERLSRIGDRRVTFHNLSERSPYPEDPLRRWRVAGTYPLNEALKRARGSWIAHLDDDDAFLPQHLETLLRRALADNLELAYSRMRKEIRAGHWKVCGSAAAGGRQEVPRGPGGEVPVMHSTVLFRSYLRLFRFDPEAWRLLLSVDEHVWRRMRHAGVRAGFVDEVTVLSELRPGTSIGYFLSEDRL